jgi:hypothetical protein
MNEPCWFLVYADGVNFIILIDRYDKGNRETKPDASGDRSSSQCRTHKKPVCVYAHASTECGTEL